jgi:alkaline phosphatase
MNPKTGERFESIAALAHRGGMRVGIVTSAFLQDATPAAFFGHAEKRAQHYELGLQMLDSGFEYFAGGGFRNPSGKDKSRKSLTDVAKDKGYAVANDLGGLRAPGTRLIATHPRASAGLMPWAIDETEGPSLADFVRRGTELLDCESGFFMMVEGGKIDLACHANDAAASVREVMALDEAVGVAVEFARSRPNETLIVVASDHETGGMSLAASSETSGEFYAVLSQQRGSYAAFERKIVKTPRGAAAMGEYFAMAGEFFGTGFRQTDEVRDAWRASMTPKGKRPSKSREHKKLYGPYEPFSVACVRTMNASAGVSWTTFYHTPKNVPVSALGAGAESFAGEYGNTGIFEMLKTAM